MKSARLLSLVLVLMLLLSFAGSALAQQQSLLPLVLVVRDGAGNPLAGLTLNLLLAGPPHQPYDNCVTDPAGECRLMLPPGAYIVSFAAGWRGREFIPAEEQNGGIAADGGYGGFGINFSESEEEQIVTFVIGQQADGRLVPVWDMSRDPNAPPQPFAMPENPLDSPEKALDGISLAPLDAAIPSSGDLAALQATASAAAPGQTPTAQAVVSDYGYSATPTAELTATPPQPTTTSPQDGLPLNVVLLGLIGLAVVAGIVVLTLVVRSRRSK